MGNIELPDTCSPQQLQQYIKEFATIVNSNRKLSRVQNIQQLKLLLFKRNEISIENRNVNSESCCNIQQLPRDAEPVNDINYLRPSRPQFTTLSQTQFKNGLDKVYVVIKNEIGHKWKELARNLEVPEGKIDEWSGLDGSERVHKTLMWHEANSLPYNWRLKLLNGLQRCRRMDLKDKVNSILDYHNITQPTVNNN